MLYFIAYGALLEAGEREGNVPEGLKNELQNPFTPNVAKRPPQTQPFASEGVGGTRKIVSTYAVPRAV